MSAVVSTMTKNIINVIILVITVLTVLADQAADLGTASDAIVAANATYPFTSLFKKKGLIYLAVMAGIFLAIFNVAFKGR